MEKKTIVYVKLNDHSQARIEMVREVEGLPSPHEQPREHLLTVNEMDAVAGKLSAKDYQSTPYFS